MQNGPVLKRPNHHVGEHTERSDERLMERVAAGDRLAMEALYARHHLRIYRFVLRLVNDAPTAEDLTSDVFLDVWKQADRFEGRSQVSTWMLSIARYKAMSALRSRAGDPLDDGIASKIPDSADNPEMVVEKQNESAVLRQCLTQLSPAHREIIDLVYYHEKSIAEVAEIIGAPPNTVKTRMFHARKRVAALLDAARAVGEFIPRPRPKGCEIMLTYPLASNAARRVNFDEVYSRAFTDSRFGQRVKLLRSDSQFENGKDTGAKQDERVDTGWHSSASA